MKFAYFFQTSEENIALATPVAFRPFESGSQPLALVCLICSIIFSLLPTGLKRYFTLSSVFIPHGLTGPVSDQRQ